MARVRVHAGPERAMDEWRRLGVPEGALGRLDLVTKQFLFIDSLDGLDVPGMMEKVKEKGGRAFLCKGDRALIAITPLALESLAMEGSSPWVMELVEAVKRRYQAAPPAFEWPGGSLDLARPRVMGILNVTPDSFSDGGRCMDLDSAMRRAGEMEAEGADMIDVGGESTRPGAAPVPPEEEWSRVGPVIRGLADSSDLLISVDTRRPEVARKALRAGADLVNDVSGLQEGMIEVVREEGAGAIVMHMRGGPRDMQSDTRYVDVVGDTYAYLERRVREAVARGVQFESLAVDPGIGFGKDLDGNLQIMSRLDEYRSMGRPLLIGASRKSFIGALTGGAADDRLEGSLAAAAVAVWQGASILRVHDVKETVRTVKVVQAMRGP